MSFNQEEKEKELELTQKSTKKRGPKIKLCIEIGPYCEEDEEEEEDNKGNDTPKNGSYKSLTCVEKEKNVLMTPTVISMYENIANKAISLFSEVIKKESVDEQSFIIDIPLDNIGILYDTMESNIKEILDNIHKAFKIRCDAYCMMNEYNKYHIKFGKGILNRQSPFDKPFIIIFNMTKK
jgi:hypothetical protein